MPIKHSCTPKGEPMCTYGEHVIDDADFFYTVNPFGGYGMSEVLCCEACIKRPENSEIRQRMIEAGATELLDS